MTGGAISLLDSVYLPLHLPAGTSFKTIAYGLPRVSLALPPASTQLDLLTHIQVGNQAFANYVDGNLHLTHINNKEDPIPICPGMSLGFVHPAGEAHIEDSGEWAACPGQDNPSTQCIVGGVPYIWDGNESDHDGPYNGVKMGCGKAMANAVPHTLLTDSFVLAVQPFVFISWALVLYICPTML